ncbi:hypothetical protein MRX96_047679 [Rhipicephalus microplus]
MRKHCMGELRKEADKPEAPLSKDESTADNGDRKASLPNTELVAGQDPRVAGCIMDIIQNVKKDRGQESPSNVSRMS